MLKRSEINRSVKIARIVFEQLGLRLPGFSDEWLTKGKECSEYPDLL